MGDDCTFPFPALCDYAVRTGSLQAADEASKRLPQELAQCPEPPTRATQERLLQHRYKGGWPTGYTLTIHSPPASWSDADLDAAAQFLERMNDFHHTPVRHLGFGRLPGGLYNGGRISLSSCESWGQQTLGTLAHEFGHALFSGGGLRIDPSRDKEYLLLSGLRTLQNASEILDDSNYFPIAEIFGHIDVDDIDGSMVMAYVFADQLFTFIEHAETPEIARWYGMAVYLFLRDRIFRGVTFHRRPVPAALATATLPAILDALAMAAVAHVEQAMAGQDIVQLEQLPEIVNAVETYAPAHHLRARYAEALWQVTAAPAETPESWLGAIAMLTPDQETIDHFEDAQVALAMARLETHYFMHGCFFRSPTQLLDDIARLHGIPATLVHGRHDMCCPFSTAVRLHKAWPGSTLVAVEGAGHSAFEPGITSALVAATDRYRDPQHDRRRG